MSDTFDRDGTPLTLAAWTEKFEMPGYKRVDETTLEDGTWISTVWIGLDHSFGMGEPLIFETMVFPSKEGPLSELAMDRYATEEEARRGHRRMVEAYRRGDIPKSLEWRHQ